MASCPHVFTTSLNLPSPHTKIYKEECTQCFDSQDLPSGVDVCLSCFNAGCPDSQRRHAQLHNLKTGHPLVLNIKRLVKYKPKRLDDNNEPPQKISKLAIIPESNEDKYEYITQIKCYACGGAEIDRTAGDLPVVIDSVMTSLSAAKKSEIQAWEDEIFACDHTRNLEQQPSNQLETQVLAHCNDCDLKENLWLCLVCGNLGCGRQQYGGIGGNGHGLDHFEKTKHSVSCKLGTITPEGTADIYCYSCNEERLDPHLGQHLANFGIMVESQQKTEKSMIELQLEQNLKFDFSMVSEDGKKFEPLYGPGYTGLKNIGNSCYMASVLQSLFSLDAFQQRYYPNALEHHANCREDAGNCLDCQLSKMADGLLSGRYSSPIESLETQHVEYNGQEGIAPSMFKALIGKGHEEFSTMRQQDAFEFFQHLISTIERKEHFDPRNDPTWIFKFSTQQRLQCMECKRVRYSQNVESCISIPVPARKAQNQEKKEGNQDQYETLTFEQCLESFGADSMIEYKCPFCNRRTPALTNTRFVTFPQVLVIHMRRFEHENWVPRKINAPVLIPEGTINFDQYLGHGKQDREELLPEEKPTEISQPNINEIILNQLINMGFPEIRCKKALIATGNNGVEIAMNWLIEHIEDPDIDAPLTATTTGVPDASEADIAVLTEMGFSRGHVKKALEKTNNDAERAVDWLFNHSEDLIEENPNNNLADHPPKFGDGSLPANYEIISVISHKGTSVHCGHYVAHIRKEGKWVLFNDNKVNPFLKWRPTVLDCNN
ncbi:hypothetical protein G9A89_008217 [Geosiphon pyriformis]|nr:hypothetical protein G9A89_008217 [Geosiphon pyriformis]